MLDPGDLNQRVTIQQEARVADSYGGADTTWGTLAQVWAKVEPVRGNERAMLAEVEAPALYRFTIRRRTDVTAAMRIVWGGWNFNIRAVNSVPSQALYMTIEAERGVA